MKRPGLRWHLAATMALASLLMTMAPAMVRAETGPDPDAGYGGSSTTASPRVAVKIGGVSVVLVSANGRLYAFVDRLEDNAPASDAELSVSARGGAALAMTKAADGLFVAPFDRVGRERDTFTVSVRSADGAGKDTAELVYSDASSGASIDNPHRGSEPSITLVSIALISAALGAAGGMLAMAWRRPAHRRVRAPAVGKASVA